MKCYNVRLSVSRHGPTAAGFLLWAQRAGYMDIFLWQQQIAGSATLLV